MAISYKGITVNIGGNTTELDRALSSINSSAKVTQNALKAVTDALKIDPNDTAAIARKYELLARAVELAAQKVNVLEQAQDTLKKKLESGEIDSDYYTSYLTQLQNARNQLNLAEQAVTDFQIAQDEAKKSTEELGKAASDTADDMAETGEKIEEVGSTSEEASGRMSDAFTAAASAIAAAGLDRLFDAVVQAIEECVTAAVDYESAITGVFKTVDGTDAQLAAITEGVKDMALEIPLAAAEIANIAETAGQLGIATDDVLGFVKVIADLAASTNLSADAAATAIAKFANITGLASEEFSNFGSALVALGNNMATTESDTMNMATRIAAASTQAGLSTPQILGFAAALSSLSLEAEAGGTAFSTALKRIQIAVETGSDDLKKFAEVAGMSAEAFANLWNTDVEAAITAFINGLGKIDGKGESTIALLNEIGFTEIRLSDAMTRLAGNQELVADALEISNTAFEKNTALSEEAAKRYETAASKFQILQNAVEQLQTAVGDDFLAALVPAAEWLTDITASAADFVEEEPAVSAAIAGIAGALTAFMGLASLTAIIGGIAAGIAALGAVGAVAVPIIAATAAIGGLAAACAVYQSNTHEVDEDTKRLAEEIEELGKAADNAKTALKETLSAFDEQMSSLDEQKNYITALIDKVEELSSVEDKTAAQKQQLLGAIDELNTALPNLGLAYDDVTDSVNKTKTEMLDFAETAYNAAKLEAAAEMLKELVKKQIEYSIQYEEAEKTVVDALNKRIAAEEELNKRLKDNNTTEEDDPEVYKKKVLELQNLRDNVELLNGVYEDARNTALSLLDRLGDTDDAIEALKEIFGGLNDAVNGTISGVETFDDFLKLLADNADNAGDSVENLADSYEDLNDQLEDAQSEYDDIADGIEEVYNAVVTAYKNEAAAVLKTAKETNKQRYENAQQHCKDMIALYEEEHAAKSKLLAEDVEGATGELQSRIDEIEGKSAAEKAAEEAADWQEKLDEYASDTKSAYDTIKDYGGKLTSTLEEYDSQQSNTSTEYAKRIADAEAAKAAAIEDAQRRIAETTAKYAADLAALDEASEEYAKKQYEMEKELAKLNADLSQAELDESVLVAEKEQAEAELKLAQDKKEALIKAAEETNSISADYVDKYNKEKLKLQAEYNKKIETAEKNSAKSKKDIATEVSDYKRQLNEELTELENKYVGQSREDAIKAANELGDLEISRAEDVVEFKKDAIDTLREKQIAAIEAQIEKSKAAADVLQAKYDEVVESQKTEEETKLDKLREFYDNANTMAQTNYDTYIKTGGAQADALNLMLSGKQEDLVKLLESHNPEFKAAGVSFANAYEEGIGNMSTRVEKLLGGSLDEALIKLNAKADEVKALWDKINEIGTAADKEAAAQKATAATATRENIVNVRAEMYEKYGKEAGDAYMQGLKTKLDDGSMLLTGNESFEEAAKKMGLSTGENYGQGLANGVDSKTGAVADSAAAQANALANSSRRTLGIESPSKVAFETGAFYGEGLALGIESTIGRVKEAAAGLGETADEAVESAADPVADTSTDEAQYKLGVLGDSYTELSGDIDEAASAADGFSNANTDALAFVGEAVEKLSGEYVELRDNAASGAEAVMNTAHEIVACMDTMAAQEGKTKKLNNEIKIAGGWMTYLSETTAVAKETFKEFFDFATGAVEGITKAFETLAATVESVMDAAESLSDPATLQRYYQIGVDSGKNYSKGLAAGIAAGKKGVTGAAADLANAAANATDEEWDINSPSKVAYDSGQNYAQGLIDGIDSMTDAVAESGENLANTLSDSVEQIVDDRGYIWNESVKQWQSPDFVANDYNYTHDGNGNVWDRGYKAYLPPAEVNVGGYIVRMTQSEADAYYDMMKLPAENDFIKTLESTASSAADKVADAAKKLIVRVGDDFGTAIGVYYDKYASDGKTDDGSAKSTAVPEMKYKMSAGDFSRPLRNAIERVTAPISDSQNALTKSLRAAYDNIIGGFSSVIRLLPTDQTINIHNVTQLDGRTLSETVSQRQYKSSVEKARNKGVVVST